VNKWRIDCGISFLSGLRRRSWLHNHFGGAGRSPRPARRRLVPAEWPAVSFTVDLPSRVILSAITTSKWSASCITGEFARGAASAAILTAGVAAPAFAQAQDAPVSLSGLNSASGVLCGLGSLPCPARSRPQPTSSARPAAPRPRPLDDRQRHDPGQRPDAASGAASSSLPGLNSVSGSIPALGNAAGAAPGVANTSGTLGSSAPASTDLSGDGSSNSSNSGSSTGLGSVTGTLSGVTGGLQNGGSISTPLSGVTGGSRFLTAAVPALPGWRARAGRRPVTGGARSGPCGRRGSRRVVSCGAGGPGRRDRDLCRRIAAGPRCNLRR